MSSINVFLLKSVPVIVIIVIFVCVSLFELKWERSYQVIYHISKSISLQTHVMNTYELREKCNNPERNILYMKSQKTGSTTWKVMFQQYAKKYDLNLCMDSSDKWHVNWPYQIDVDKLTKHFHEKCEMIADEMVYNETIIQQLMNEDPFLLTSVRHPVQHFLSLYKYARIHEVIEQMLGEELSFLLGIETYLDNFDTVRNFWSTLDEAFVQQSPVALLKRNLQIYTLGLDAEKPNKGDIIKMANKIHHFIVLENATESLVLLQKKLCCTMNDLYFTKHNVGRTDDEASLPIPQYLINKILAYNNGDLILYNQAKKRMKKDIEKYKTFSEDTVKFKIGLKNYMDFCEGGIETNVPGQEDCPQSSTLFFADTETQIKWKLSQKLSSELRERTKNHNAIPTR